MAIFKIVSNWDMNMTGHMRHKVLKESR